ncbi:hypothetical protein V8C44DRAFT_341432 [Trichoderma aethiopicum]
MSSGCHPCHVPRVSQARGLVRAHLNNFYDMVPLGPECACCSLAGEANEAREGSGGLLFNLPFPFSHMHAGMQSGGA